jgi:hypothetical protein
LRLYISQTQNNLILSNLKEEINKKISIAYFLKKI